MEERIESIIAQNLIELRKSRNLKQSELSEAIGYSDKTISRWENGTSVPDIVTLQKLAKFYNVSINDFINENAVGKVVVNIDDEKEKNIKNVSNLFLAILTVWLIAGIVYTGTIIVQSKPFWEIFLFAIPISAFFAYRHVSRSYNVKWLNLLFSSIVVISIICAIYFTIWSFNNDYNIWQLFFLIIPLEGMCIVNTLLKKKKEKKPRREKK